MGRRAAARARARERPGRGRTGARDLLVAARPRRRARASRAGHRRAARPARSPARRSAGAAGAAAVDDLPPGRRTLRSLLPQRTATTVVAELGPPDADRTVVLVAHHDAAHAGLLFHPAIPERSVRPLPVADRARRHQPAADGARGRRHRCWRALGALTGSRALPKAGAALGAAVGGGARRHRRCAAAVPGANDNATGVAALLALGARARRRAHRERPGDAASRPPRRRFCEGMQAFGKRHFGELPRESTFFSALDTLGSPHLLVLRGEGMIRMREYPARSLALLDGVAEELGIWLFAEPAPPQRAPTASSRSPRAIRMRRALLVHRPQAAGQLPLAHRHAGERRLRHAGRRGPAQPRRWCAGSTSAGL